MKINFITKTLFSFLIISLLAACSPAATLPPPPPATETPPPPTPTELVLPEATATPIEMATPTPQPARTRYTLNTTIDYDAKTVMVDQIIRYANLTGDPLNALVLAAVPNLWLGSFKLESIHLDNKPVTNFTLNGQRIDIPLTDVLESGDIINIEIQYALSLPFAEQKDPNVARPQIYGYTNRQINLVDWYPFVVPYLNGEWTLHDPWFYGEHLVMDIADYEVNLRFTNPDTAPIVAASGFAEPQEDFTRYTIDNARTFALAASREFQVGTTQVGDVTLTSYYFPFNERGGQGALQASAEAVQVFSEKFGPYPHRSLSIVMGDFNDGMEYSAFFYLSKDFYNLYDGTPANYLTFVAVHETAHQWWFEQIASDQALQPWLDESLSTYSERIYYENIHPDLVSWWWTYRIDFYKPEGFVDIPVYEGQGFRTYTNATYFQGAHFLEKLRQRIGDEAFFNFLKDYLNRGKNRIVTAEEFFQILRMSTSADISDLINQYFRNVY